MDAEDRPDDPLWLHSPGKRRAFRAACYLLAVGLGALLVGLITRSAWGALAGAAAMGFGIVNARGWIADALEARWASARAWTWRHRQGVHHSFAGVWLDVHDDGRDCWLHEPGLRTLLGLQRAPPDALKARFSGQWRTADELGLRGRGLWLNAAAVHQHLADAGGRMDPKRLKLRSYLDREILQPAARRRERARGR